MKKNKNLHHLILLVTLPITGCTFLGLSPPKEPYPPSTEKLIYDFSEPRRSTLTDKAVSGLRLTANERRSGRYYFSASGLKCMNISISDRRVACFKSGKWLEAAAVLSTTEP